jgi:hypothetical protein
MKIVSPTPHFNILLWRFSQFLSPTRILNVKSRRNFHNERIKFQTSINLSSTGTLFDTITSAASAVSCENTVCFRGTCHTPG